MPPRVASREALFSEAAARAASRPRKATFMGPAAATAASVAAVRDAAARDPDLVTSGCCRRHFVKGRIPLFSTVLRFLASFVWHGAQTMRTKITTSVITSW